VRVSLLAWTAEIDLGTTEAVYRRLPGGAAERCGCLPCRNFHAVRPLHYGEGFTALLASLGIDPSKEHAVRLVSPLEGERYLYAGTYGFFGEILAGRPLRGFPRVREEVDVFERVGHDTYVALRPWTEPPRPWGETSCVRLEFLVVLPWALDETGAPVQDLGRRSRRFTS
jgi:hypothetical protein